MAREIDFDPEGNLILKVKWRALLKVATIIIASILSYFLPLEGLTGASRICLSLFVGATGLWITEAIPPFATAIMIIVLSVYLLGQPGGPLGLDASGLENSYQIFLNPISSPILVLFFGGFILALAANKHGLDIRLARALIKPFGTHPRMLLLGIILTTALFSMFMSNTATTAMMIAIIGPLFRKFEGREPFKKALVLAVPFAANLGGMGTIIGTPPNAVAASVLEKLGHPITFGSWMIIGVPLVLVLLFILWSLLFRIFRPRTDHFEILFPESEKITWDLLVVVITFFVTIFLWLTGPFFNITPAVAALLPIMVFTMFGILGREDLQKIEWHILFLIAGGMTLGVAMKTTGLSQVFFHYLEVLPLAPLWILMIVSVFAIAMSNFMSNTAAANLIIPIAISLSVGSPAFSVIVVALSCSMAMSLPISTPPNAIAFATEVVETKDLIRYGTLISAIGMVFMWAMLFGARYLLDWL